ncbi:MAG: penicillin-binding protein activator [Gammaproteobacteria bacterium]
MQRLLTILTIFAITALLASCAKSPYMSPQYLPPTSAKVDFSPVDDNPMVSQGDLEALKTTNQLIDAGEYNAAQQYITQISLTNLSPELIPYYQLMQARLASAYNQPNIALQYLSKIDQQLLKSDTQLFVLHLQAWNFYHNNQPLSSGFTRITMQPYFGTDTQLINYNNKAIWQDMSLGTYQRLKANKYNSQGDKRAWLDIAIISKRDANNTTQLVNALSDWQNTYPNSSANRILPSAKDRDALLQTPIPKNITLILPLSGKFAALGAAVRNGFMSAYYAASNKPQINFCDTASTSAEACYQQAQNDGTDFIIGPLTKENVKHIANRKTDTPTLTLNYTDDGSASNNVIQFGLSPIDEAQEVADLAWRQGHLNAIIIAPSDHKGSQVESTFVQHWQSLGGNVTETLHYQTNTPLAPQISQLLLVNNSQARESELTKQLGERIQHKLRRRQDFDMVFLIATPQSGREIKPLLKFYYANNIAVYSTSSIYTGTPNQHADRDLNGVRFCDTPWLASSQYRPQQQNLTNLWKSEYVKLSRLYALGKDAFLISQNFERLRTLPNFPLQGATGDLTLTSEHRIYRQLICTEFYYGIPKTLR